MPAVTLVAALGFAAAWIMVWKFIPAHRNDEIAAELAAGFSYTPLLVLGLVVGLAISGEMTALMWSAPLLYYMSPALAALSGAGAAFFGLCMAAVRFGGDRLRARYGDVGTILGSLLAALGGFIIIGQSHHYILSLVGFAITGFGTACIVPTLFAMAAAQVPGNRAAGLGVVSLIAGVPRTLAPWVFGAVAQATSTSAAFGLCAVGLAAAFVLMVLLTRLKLRYA
jgi:predicted MFS family arabinose efflux permease